MATIRIPTPLRRLTDGKEEVAAAGATIAEVLADLEAKHPGFREKLFDAEGRIKRHVNIFANDEDIRFLSNLETPVADGDEVSIVPAIAGGH